MAFFSYAVDFWVKEKKEMKVSLSVLKKMALGELCWTIQRKGIKYFAGLSSNIIVIFAW